MASTIFGIVDNTFTNAQIYAANAQGSLATYLSSLNGLVYNPPTISVNWASISAPVLPSLPAQPTFPDLTLTLPTSPSELSIADPGLTVDTFTDAAPSTSIGTAPTIVYGTTPTIPTPNVITVPDAPTVVLPAVPTYLSLTTPTFAGIDTHEGYLSNLNTIPTLDLVAPTPYRYNRGDEYASTLLSSLKSVINSRLAGGTGLNPAVEQAIWDRARSRETSTWLSNIADIQRGSEAQGFHLPTGVVAAQLEAAQQAYYGKVSDLSRDVAIKQAELEQENLKQSIEVGMGLEKQLIDYSLQLERIAFDSAVKIADNDIQIYNAQVDKYKALLDAYRTYAAAYDTIIKGQLAKVDVYKAELAGEQAKADINKVLVEEYKASIEATMTVVEIYRAQVAGAQALVTIEQAKIAAAGEQVRAYTAQVNAETAKVEAYKASVQAEETKVHIYTAKAQAFASRVGAQAEVARANTARYEALIRAKTGEWDGYRARVEAERARLAALGQKSSNLLDSYRAAAAAIEATAGMNTRIWEGQIKNYEASQQVAIQAAKINGDFAVQANNARLDAAKVGAQVYSQLTASAYSMMHASVGGSVSANNAVSYSYSNDTQTAAPTVTST